MKTQDLAVASLLSDQAKGGGEVVKAIQDVLSAVRQHDLDYGSQVRVLTKALMIVNEEHRVGT